MKATIRSKRLRASVASAAVGMLAAAGAAPADTAPADTAQADSARPNILFILADDLGWTDVQTGNTNFGNGSDYHRTPYVNQLARQGMSFTSAYATPLCSPTRASLMTGQSMARHGMYSVNRGDRGDRDAQGLTAVTNRRELPGSSITLAETLSAAGYDTFSIGKWHLGNDGEGTGPRDQGFAYNFAGTAAGNVGETNFADAGGAFTLPGATGKPGQFIADRMSEVAIELLNERVSGAQPDADPFFMYYSLYSVHTPIQAPQENIDRLNGVPKGQRHANQTYAAMVENMDDNIGRLINYLETTNDPNHPGQKLISNTIVIFASDNGGLGGYEGTGVTAQEITRQPPLRGGKGMLSEGGVRVPLIVRWDGKVGPNTISNTPVSMEDFYPTLASVAGAQIPEEHVIDGVDISGLLRGESSQLDRNTLYWHFPGYLEANDSKFRATPTSVALRDGRWKLFYFYETQTWALYDLATDIGETHNLIDEHTVLASQIGTDLVNWLTEVGADLPMIKGTTQPVPMPTAPVPEPMGSAMMLLGGGILARRRRAAGHRL